MSHASQAMLDSEFGTHKEEDVVQKILETGSLQETSVCRFLLYATWCIKSSCTGKLHSFIPRSSPTELAQNPTPNTELSSLCWNMCHAALKCISFLATYATSPRFEHRLDRSIL